MNLKNLRLPALALACAAALAACGGEAPTAPDAAPKITPSFDAGYLGSGNTVGDGGIVGGGGGATTNSPVLGGGGGRTEQCPEGTTFDPVSEECRSPVLGGGGG